MVAMLRAVRQVGGGINPGKRSEIVDEVGLVEVAAIQRDVGPFHSRAVLYMLQRPLEALDAAEHFGRKSSFIAKHLDKALGAKADLFADRRNGWHLGSSHEPAQRESHGGVAIGTPRKFGQQDLL